MNVKINDNVLVIAGKDKGKQGKILATSPKANTVVVEGVHIQKKHEKARKANETSKIVSEPGPIDASNVMVVCPVCGKPTRVKHAVVDGKKVRVCGAKKADGTVCGAVLDKASPEAMPSRSGADFCRPSFSLLPLLLSSHVTRLGLRDLQRNRLG